MEIQLQKYLDATSAATSVGTSEITEVCFIQLCLFLTAFIVQFNQKEKAWE